MATHVTGCAKFLHKYVFSIIAWRFDNLGRVDLLDFNTRGTSYWFTRKRYKCFGYVGFRTDYCKATPIGRVSLRKGVTRVQVSHLKKADHGQFIRVLSQV